MLSYKNYQCNNILKTVSAMELLCIVLNKGSRTYLLFFCQIEDYITFQIGLAEMLIWCWSVMCTLTSFMIHDSLGFTEIHVDSIQLNSFMMSFQLSVLPCPATSSWKPLAIINLCYNWFRTKIGHVVGDIMGLIFCSCFPQRPWKKTYRFRFSQARINSLFARKTRVTAY